MLEIDSISLSKDQEYLLFICKVPILGTCPPDVENRRPEQLCHSSWLTFAARILRLYIVTKNHSKNLLIVAKFVIIAPMWFTIETNLSYTQGAKHLWKEVKLSRYLNPGLKSIVDPVLQRSAYFVHPENLPDKLLIYFKKYNINESENLMPFFLFIFWIYQFFYQKHFYRQLA